MTDLILDVKGLRKTFQLSAKQQKIEKTKQKVKVAVDNLSFCAHRGEIFGLLGPNGAGKTTTLRMLATLIKPDAGDALVDGASIVREPEQVRSRIGFLTSELKLEDFFTPNYLYDFFSHLHQVPADVRRARKQGEKNEEEMEIWKIREHPELAEQAAAWFHAKWGVPQEAYRASMQECLQGSGGVPQWYAAVKHGKIAAGIGVIENDFHNRKDLTPNVCALYVENEYRGKGLAGRLLQAVCQDMAAFGIDTLYLLTDHTSYHERYGWDLLCMVQGDGDSAPSRLYLHKNKGL